MEKSTSTQSRVWAHTPEVNDESPNRDLTSRKGLEKTAEVPDVLPGLNLADDLPAEIRLNIYRHLFNVPGRFFELNITPEARYSRFMNSHSVLLAQIGGLRMMRVCKKIRGEVAEYFYGSNAFRSSQPNSIVFMSCFFHTIGNFNCSFLKHITLQMPNPWIDAPWIDASIPSLRGWDNICRKASRQGLRNPDYEYLPKYNQDSRSWGEYCYDEAVRRVFSKLRDMPNLKQLEVTIPAKYGFFNFDTECTGQQPLRCDCLGGHIQTMSPDDRIRHLFRDHSGFGEYLDLLADLKETAASEDLTITLVFLYSEIKDRSTELGKLRQEWDNSFRCREGSWTAAYAAIMGYELGHARWEPNDKNCMTYTVRYGEDPMPPEDTNA